MNTTITQSQIEFYDDNGFIIIEDFLTPAELSSGATQRTKRCNSGWNLGMA